MITLRGPSSPFELAAFVIFGALAVASALATVMLRNPIRCAVGLFVHVLSLAGLYLNLSAHFLAAIQLLVYAGAVVVLFVFVIMLLGPAANTPKDSRGVIPRVVGLLCVAVVGGVVIHTMYFVRRIAAQRPAGFGTLREVGRELFTNMAIPFELIGVTLTVAVVGAFAIAHGHHKKRVVTSHGGVASEEGFDAPHGPVSGSRGARDNTTPEAKS